MSVAEKRTHSVFAPNGRKPRLLLAREPARAVVMPNLREAGSSDVTTPGGKVQKSAIAVTA